MSFVLKKNNQELDDAIAKAIHDDIVVICSTPDEGSNERKSWPAMYDGVIPIAPSDQWGHICKEASAEHAKFLLQGKGITSTRQPKEVEASKELKGSSV